MLQNLRLKPRDKIQALNPPPINIPEPRMAQNLLLAYQSLLRIFDQQFFDQILGLLGGLNTLGKLDRLPQNLLIHIDQLFVPERKASKNHLKNQDS